MALSCAALGARVEVESIALISKPRSIHIINYRWIPDRGLYHFAFGFTSQQTDMHREGPGSLEEQFPPELSGVQLCRGTCFASFLLDLTKQVPRCHLADVGAMSERDLVGTCRACGNSVELLTCWIGSRVSS